MGFLHEGHASLIRRCREENDIVVVSDFVNPTQFGPTEDLEAYPRDFERDSELCESLGADLIFHPEPKDMYHDPHAYVSIDTLSDTLCGKTRPIHFKGDVYKRQHFPYPIEILFLNLCGSSVSHLFFLIFI